MAKMLSLREQAKEFFEFALQQTCSRASLEKLYHLIRQCEYQLEQPMRVAIVGKIKAGKSTAINALLGEALVVTGTVEATFNVNWLRYGEKSSLKVHFKDKRPPETKSISELADLTKRSDRSHQYLLNIAYIEVFYPNPILQTFNLIDTPGLESYYQDDSENTRQFLNLHGKKLSEITQIETAKADAVLYLFNQSVHTADAVAMEEFQGSSLGKITPINAIAVLTKIDSYWQEANNPLTQGEKIAQRLMSEYPQLRHLFHTIRPLAGCLALGAQTLAKEEFETLKRLAELSEERLERLLRTVERFTSKEYPEEPQIPQKSDRSSLLDRLGQYGVFLACQLLREQNLTQLELQKRLLDASGVPQLKQLIVSHFGNRAFLIKFNTGLQQIKAACFQIQQNCDQDERSTCETHDLQAVNKILAKIEEIEINAHDFQELKVLRSYYLGKLDFHPNEVQQLLNITGENGTSCAERLGNPERATVAEMLIIAKESMYYWRSRANDYINSDTHTLEAARILSLSFERVFYRLSKAKKYLYL
ncbi:GTP-binding protein HSR1-related protein [Stanieria cyanosphaera PCC 7437]|uniref:GTP-binding protein HSR1-related protein n=1 Tax=Stanieria cyanosphaera (strain ATCC 29371 / PCC 7437) TaxID=111780 RepID=K9Y0N5_STAC7|nr:dynamin family protein [Stanieria cyanosphaera]AFZ37951.1 GTP-binding protein HSR1-related protein [Stanieria cyanosphaera PCC 7437]